MGEDVKCGHHPWSFAITHLIDTSVGVRDELTDRCPHIWLHWINTHTDLWIYHAGIFWKVKSEYEYWVNVLLPPVQVSSLWKYSWQTARRAEARGGTSLSLCNSPGLEISVHVSATWIRPERNTRRPGEERSYCAIDDMVKMWYHILLWYYILNDVSDLELSSYPLDKEAPAVVSGVYESQSSQLHPDGCHNGIHFLITKQVWNIP